jgi:hypothetical protein
MRNAAYEPDLRVVVEVVGSAVCVDRLTGWQSPLTFPGTGLLCPVAANPPARPPVADKPGLSPLTYTAASEVAAVHSMRAPACRPAARAGG